MSEPPPVLRSGVPGSPGSPRPSTIAAVVLAVLVAANYAHWILTRLGPYNRLHGTAPWYLAELVDKALLLALVVLALHGLYRLGPRGLRDELRLGAPVLPAIGFAAVAVLPMVVGFALTRRFAPDSDLPTLAFTGLLSPLVEEIHVRGFGFWQLRRRLRWPFWAAVAPQAMLSGLGHIEKGTSAWEVAGIFLLLASGGVVFSWLLEEWRSLWVPFFLHAAMNLTWDLFSVSNTVLGGWFPFAVQQVTMLTALAITWRMRRTMIAEAGPGPREPPVPY